MGVKERSRLRVGAIALAAVVFAAGNRSAVSAQEPGFMRPTAVWSGPAAPLAAGRYAAAVDLSTAPDGALWLLDGLGSGLQRRSADGDWTRLLPLPGGLNGQRLTAANEWLWLLGRRGTAWRLLRLMPAGGTDLELAVGALGQTPIDLSARPDGGVVLTTQEARAASPDDKFPYEAQSHGSRAPCVRFAARVTPAPRNTRFRLVASLCRAGLGTR